VCCEMIDRRRTEAPNEDEENDDDTEFAPGKKIKLENAANSTGNFVEIWSLRLRCIVHSLNY